MATIVSPSKALADILEEELDGATSEKCTQEDPVGEKQLDLERVYARIHAETPERSALCLSGGGIRSAIFGLGILQGLARHGLLPRFDFLSTVSGGGYVGSWLSAWIKNEPGGLPAVVEKLTRRPASALNPEPPPIRHLRSFSNYLTPRTGFLSVDTWTLIAVFSRNLFLNWLVLISWLGAALMLPRIYLATILLPSNDFTEAVNYLERLQHYKMALNGVLAAAFALLAVAMAYAIIDVPSTGNARLRQSSFLKWRQIPLSLAALLLALWWAIVHNIGPLATNGFEYNSRAGLLRFIAFSLGSYFAGGLLAGVFCFFKKSARQPHHFIASIGRLLAILIPALVGSVMLWVVATRIFSAPSLQALNYVCFAPPLVLLDLLFVNFLFTGLASRFSEDEDREWWGRSAAWLLIGALAWILVCVVVLWGAQLIISPEAKNQLDVFLGSVQSNPLVAKLLGAFGGVTGLVTALLAFRSKASKKNDSSGSAQWPLLLAALVFFVTLSVLISWTLIALGAQAKNRATGLVGSGYQGQLLGIFLVTGTLLLLGLVMGFVIDVNKFSLHAMYRSRLIRAFLGASRPRDSRRPNLFTGFDPADNFPLQDLVPTKPFHVINAALNLTKGEELAWQERKAESFTMSRLHCGSWHLGYRPTEKYGNGITLGTAIAISGAAANPSMGYHSSPIVSFLMTLFNVRLGWWLGNPGAPGAHTWRLAGPRYAVGPLFSEAFGNTSGDYAYVDLSDGGHFENLGLYEMVLRRCKFIFVVDAGQDFDYVFEDLGNALRKIRIDLGLTIDLKVVAPKKETGAVHHCAFGTIDYAAIDGPGASSGALIYVKPVISGDEPPDVSNYAAAHPEFPHETTSDQWFSESQLESYRLLGLHAVEAICGADWSAKSLPEFFAQVKTELAPKVS